MTPDYEKDYNKFLQAKAQCDIKHGFEPVWIPDFLFDFQKALVLSRLSHLASASQNDNRALLPHRNSLRLKRAPLPVHPDVVYRRRQPRNLRMT